MEHLWFTVGMLLYEFADVSIPRSIGGDLTAETVAFHRALLGAFVRWLPEIRALSSRFATEQDTASEASAMNPLFWVYKILFCAYHAGFRRLPGDDLLEQERAIATEFGGDVTEWLVAEKVVEWDGKRPVLRESR